MKSLLLGLAALLALPLAGCAVSQKDASAREWQRTECNRVIDADDRLKCLKRVE